jgi:hypothetical protein
MKLIELKTLPGEGQVPEVVYATVLREVIKRPLDPQRGAEIAEIRQSIRVLDAIDKANGVLELEDSDYEHLKQKTLAMPWNMIDRRIIEFVDDVTSAGA